MPAHLGSLHVDGFASTSADGGVVDFVAIGIALAFIAVMLMLIKGIDRI
jgi:hypothetical protein